MTKVKKTRSPKIDRNSPYADKNGRFKLPELPPNCFGLAVHYTLTSEDVENGLEAYGNEFSNDTNGNGFVLREPIKAGDVIECGQYTVRNTPYKKRQVVGARITKAFRDTCTISVYKAGSAERMDDLRAFYSNLSLEDDLLSEDDCKSPFDVDIASAISKSAIGKAFEDYSHTEKEAE